MATSLVALFSTLTVVALAAPVGVAASASTGKTDIGGTLTHTVPLSTVAAFRQAGLTLSAVSPGRERTNTANQTANFVYPVTGGNGDVVTHSGSVRIGGGIKISSSNGRSVTATHVVFYLATATFYATPSGSNNSIPWETVSGITTSGTRQQTYNATTMTLTPGAAAYINNALDSTLFVGGSGGPSVGSLESTWIYI